MCVVGVSESYLNSLNSKTGLFLQQLGSVRQPLSKALPGLSPAPPCALVVVFLLVYTDTCTHRTPCPHVCESPESVSIAQGRGGVWKYGGQ